LINDLLILKTDIVNVENQCKRSQIQATAYFLFLTKYSGYAKMRKFISIKI